MANGILGLPPGLRGFVAAEQLANQRNAQNFNMRQGILGMKNAMEQRELAARLAPLRERLLAAQVKTAENPAPLLKDMGGHFAILNPTTFEQIGTMPKTASPDAVLREGGAMTRHSTPSGSAVLQNQGAMQRHATPSGSALLSERGAMTRHSTPSGSAIFSASQPVWDSERGVFVPRGPAQMPTQGQSPMPTGLGHPPLPMTQPGAIPVPGLPPSRAQLKEERERTKEANRRELAIQKADTVIRNVDKAIGQAGFNTTGFPGAILGQIPGTDAFDLRKTVTTIKANIGFQELQAMREASPTGGALGQVAVQELEALQAVLGSLDADQSQAQLVENLNAVKRHYENWKRAVTEAQGGAQSQAAPSPSGWGIRRID